MKIAWLSDLHLVVPGGDPPRGVDPAFRAKLCLDDVRARHADADRLVITGDLIQLRHTGAYGLLKELLEEMPMPARLLVGNHDDRAAFLEAFPDMPNEFGYVQSSEMVDGHQLIYLDTVAAGGKHHGQLDSVRLQWLDRALGHCDCPALLFMHHPPTMVGIPALDKMRLNEGDAGLLEILHRHSHRLIHLFCGHVHRSISGTWGGFPYAVMTTPHVGFELDMQQHKLLPVDEAPGYGVIQRLDSSIIVHTQVINVAGSSSFGR
ncbi:metallophosphoesterase [Pseudomonas alliivorans]|uniref:metallophosphoesterase n=1 Tax=Pseudomonas aeruginosa TaxID=287 RepID=UPI001AEC5EC3|nr:metallophosphoesterase [Pseudomonas aeruginosa]MBP2698156.1 phosphodiesterase [Pseudomonas aeruginosa]MEE4747892.1 metallophosphoesterase [Pseudomonas alliivorans]